MYFFIKRQAKNDFPKDVEKRIVCNIDILLGVPEPGICNGVGEINLINPKEVLQKRRGFPLIGSGVEDQISEITIFNFYYIFR